MEEIKEKIIQRKQKVGDFFCRNINKLHRPLYLIYIFLYRHAMKDKTRNNLIRIKDYFVGNQRTITREYAFVVLTAVLINGLRIETELELTHGYSYHALNIIRLIAFGVFYSKGHMLLVLYLVIGFILTILRHYVKAVTFEQKDIRGVFYSSKASIKPAAIYNKKGQVVGDKDRFYYEDEPEYIKGDILGIDPCTKENVEISQRIDFHKRNIFTFTSKDSEEDVCLIIPMLQKMIARKESIVLLDHDGSFYANTAEMAKRYGYIIRVIRSDDPFHSSGINPLSLIGNDIKRAKFFAKTILQMSEEVFFEQGEIAILTLLILYVSGSENVSEKNRTMQFVYKMAKQNPDDLINTILDYCNRYIDDNNREITVSKEDLSGTFLDDFARRLILFKEDKFLWTSTAYCDGNVIEMCSRPCVYYIMLPEKKKHYNERLLYINTLVDLLLQNLSRPGNGIPINIVLYQIDRFPSYIQGISSGLKKTRYTNTRYIITTASLDKFREIYSSTSGNNNYPIWKEIERNCRVHLILGADSKEIAKELSERIGKTLLWKIEGTDESKKPFISSIEEEFIIKPEEIENLPYDGDLYDSGEYGHMIALYREKHPYIIEKAYMKWEALKKLSPEEYEPGWWEKAEGEEWFAKKKNEWIKKKKKVVENTAEFEEIEPETKKEKDGILHAFIWYVKKEAKRKIYFAKIGNSHKPKINIKLSFLISWILKKYR